jgi:hypothetical protein
MMSLFVSRILRFGSLLSFLLMSGAGWLVFIRSSRLGAVEREGSDAEATISGGGRSSKRLVGISAALFLMAFVTSEALVMIRAFCR